MSNLPRVRDQINSSPQEACLVNFMKSIISNLMIQNLDTLINLHTDDVSTLISLKDEMIHSKDNQSHKFVSCVFHEQRALLWGVRSSCSYSSIVDTVPAMNILRFVKTTFRLLLVLIGTRGYAKLQISFQNHQSIEQMIIKINIKFYTSHWTRFIQTINHELYQSTG